MAVKNSVIVEKLIERAFELGKADSGFSLYDCSDDLRAIDAHIEAGDALADLLGCNGFILFIESNKKAKDMYMKGYADSVSELDDMPDDLNEGIVEGIQIELSKKDQAKIWKMVELKT